MTNLFDYLTGKVVKKKKGKKITRRRRTRWGERMGKVAKESNNKKDSKIEKLLDILIARSAPTNTIELARMKQIEGDFQLAQDLQQKELMKSKGKKIEEEQPDRQSPKEAPTIGVAESPITSVDRQHRFQAYQKEFNSLEEGYEGLLETLKENMGETSVISGAAMSEFIARKEQLNANRNVLRKDLLEDIKNNPSEVWEWRGFIEQSENETAQLLDLDNKVSQILYDQAMRNISEREALTEQQVAQAEENKKLMEEQLRQNEIQQEKEKDFTNQLEEQNRQITEQKEKLVKEATEKELAIEELDKTQNFLSKKISETFDKGKETLQTNYIEGGVLDFAKKADFKIALGQTGLEESWGEITRYYQQPQQRKEALNRKLVEKIKEQEQFLPKRVEGLIGALPPGSVMLQRESSLESLSPSRSPPRIEVEQSE
tara:strand:- start:183 stop:1472 length:1290 start_codon:yes stop_codon:yes gene_type:complete